MYIVIDTETTGVKTYKDRITQLCFILYNEQGDVVNEYAEYIRPDGWTIPITDFFINNGMSTARCEDEGVPLFEALRHLQNNLKLADIVIGHNISFDKKIILSEMKRSGVTHQLLQYKKTYCTMNESRKLVKAKNKNGALKQPSLQEAYYFFFEEFIKDNHDAKADVLASNRIYRKLKNN